MTNTSDDTIPVACTLTAPELAERVGINRALFGTAEEVRSLPDGHAFRFPSDAGRIDEILQFVAAERECCRFSRFTLEFEPDLGPVWLQVRGPAGVKAFTDSMAS